MTFNRRAFLKIAAVAAIGSATPISNSFADPSEFIETRKIDPLDKMNMKRIIYKINEYVLDSYELAFEETINDSTTRNAHAYRIRAFVQNLVNQRVVRDFMIICSDQNNTPAHIDRGDLVTDVYVLLHGSKFPVHLHYSIEDSLRAVS